MHYFSSSSSSAAAAAIILGIEVKIVIENIDIINIGINAKDFFNFIFILSKFVGMHVI
jgi:hypothetical protein